MGIILLSLWAIIIAITSLANVLLLSRAALQLEAPHVQNRIWVVFGLNVLFFISFNLSAYGLWQRHNWGRWLFMVTISVWAGFGMLAFVLPNFPADSDESYTVSEQALNLLRYLVSLILPIVYLNLPYVKPLFLLDEGDG